MVPEYSDTLQGRVERRLGRRVHLWQATDDDDLMTVDPPAATDDRLPLNAAAPARWVGAVTQHGPHQSLHPTMAINHAQAGLISECDELINLPGIDAFLSGAPPGLTAAAQDERNLPSLKSIFGHAVTPTDGEALPVVSDEDAYIFQEPFPDATAIDAESINTAGPTAGSSSSVPSAPPSVPFEQLATDAARNSELIPAADTQKPLVTAEANAILQKVFDYAVIQRIRSYLASRGAEAKPHEIEELVQVCATDIDADRAS
ncbi:hypothetical protein BKA62DRAFT_761051 [Auriculariales sp. MPI-PUGE-AT-0066]|nr:hypothetical protein BKA62DRAFT_761051 [Auriculariales sp. MPI-PUGE-AT-0066]